MALSLSKMVAEFSLAGIFHQVWENFLNLWCSPSLKMHWIKAFLLIFSPVPHSKLQVKFFENLFPATAESGRENYGLFYPNSITKYEDHLEH